MKNNEIIETIEHEPGIVETIRRPRIPHIKHILKYCPHCKGTTAHVLTGESDIRDELHTCLLCRNEHSCE